MRRTLGIIAFALVFLWLGQVAAQESPEKTSWRSKGELNAARHEEIEGYYALGEEGTIIAKRGTALYYWLFEAKGHRIQIAVDDERPEPSKISR